MVTFIFQLIIIELSGILFNGNGTMAQLGARLNRTQEVGSSNLLGSTINKV